MGDSVVSTIDIRALYCNKSPGKSSSSSMYGASSSSKRKACELNHGDGGSAHDDVRDYGVDHVDDNGEYYGDDHDDVMHG